MSDLLVRFDSLIAAGGPAAIVLKEHLRPVAGEDSVLFPPTFAPPEGSRDPAGYVIDQHGTGAVCLVDTVGSQANRLEPLFKKAEYRALVPKVTIHIGKRKVDLLDAGHRAADAVARFSDLGDEFEKAFRAYQDAGDALPLAKIAPTTLVFGAWDSRGTQAKAPRLVESTIRAYDVVILTRSGQYFSLLEKEELEGMEIDAGALGEKFPSEEGLVDNPVGRVHGGIVARGGIRREAILNLTALRAAGTPDTSRDLPLRRYILGLSLLALFAPSELYLRQGCLLVRVASKPLEVYQIDRQGKEETFPVGLDEIEVFATAAAAAFEVGPDREGTFQPDRVKQKRSEKVAKKAAKSKNRAT